MKSKYPLVPLGEVAKVHSGFAFKSSDMGNSGYPIIKIKNINPPAVDIEKCDYIDEEVIQNIPNVDKYLLHSGDILIAMTGATAGKVGRFYSDGDNYFLNQRVGKVHIFENNLSNAEYIYQILSTKKFSRDVLALSSGSAQGNISGSQIETYKIPLPPIEIQNSIGNILSTLDKKIKLNKKRNQTLEEIAKLLFKSWFIDFDPVKAKIENHSTGLPDEISNFFPDSFIDSDIGKIPSGWGVKKLGQIIELAYGKSLRESERIEGSFSVFGSNGIVGTHKNYLVKGPGIVVGRKGNPGIVKWSDNNFFPIDTTFYVKPISDISEMTFLFFVLLNQKLSNLSADSAVPGLNRNIAYMNQQVIPSSNVISLFEEQVRELFLRKKISNLESSSLQNLRDCLLPKLISGELNILDAEKMTAEAGI